MRRTDCQFFNPMYIQLKCDRCQKLVGTICANECGKNICKKCHQKTSFFALLKYKFFKTIY